MNFSEAGPNLEVVEQHVHEDSSQSGVHNEEVIRSLLFDSDGLIGEISGQPLPQVHDSALVQVDCFEAPSSSDQHDGFAVVGVFEVVGADGPFDPVEFEVVVEDEGGRGQSEPVGGEGLLDHVVDFIGVEDIGDFLLVGLIHHEQGLEFEGLLLRIVDWLWVLGISAVDHPSSVGQ